MAHKQWRGLVPRYEKRAVNYRAMVVIASIVIWLHSWFVRQALIRLGSVFPQVRVLGRLFT